MDRSEMTNDENYQLDVAGYLILPGVLTAAELAACNGALDRLDTGTGERLRWTGPASTPLSALRHHPVLVRYLEQICGDGFRLDTSPCLLGPAGGGGALTGGDELVDWSRAYRVHNGERFCQAVRAVWALSDSTGEDGGLVVVPASHHSTLQAPDDLLRGTDDMGLVVRPPLRAGDLMLCVASIIHGVRPGSGGGFQRLLTCGYVAAGVRPSAGSEIRGQDEEMSEWMASLTPEQRALVHNPNRPFPPPVVQSDGQRVWLDAEGGVHHPTTMRRDPDCGIDEKEFYHWDLCGHLVLRGVMDADWLAAANEAIDANPDRIHTGGSAAGGAAPLAGSGTPRSSMGDPWKLPPPHGEPFQRMIAAPALIQRLNWIMGSGFEAMICNGFLSAAGSSGHLLHAANVPARVTNHYRQQNGRVYAEYLNVAWQLRDVTRADGGFVCVPGSHKASYPMPEGIRTCEIEMGLVRHIEMQAGDALLFLASAQAHGAYPWTGTRDRRMVLFQYRSRNLYAP